jgi:deazaflavin-dependent oxidoreductase (nitroreductase family)
MIMNLGRIFELQRHMNRKPAVKPRLGRRMASFNRRVTNHLTRPVARRLPGFGVVSHTGRRSRRRYQTPVNVFDAPDGYVIALTYGADSDWVRNVLAAGGCELLTRGRRHDLTSPRIVQDERRHCVPPIVRPALRLLRVSEFMELRASAPDHPS